MANQNIIYSSSCHKLHVCVTYIIAYVFLIMRLYPSPSDVTSKVHMAAYVAVANLVQYHGLDKSTIYIINQLMKLPPNTT